MIPWRPIAEMPEELKDGREVLVWVDCPVVVWWNGGRWACDDDESFDLSGMNHFCEITPPEGM